MTVCMFAAQLPVALNHTTSAMRKDVDAEQIASLPSKLRRV